MSKLASYREKEELMRKLQEEMRKLEEDEQLKQELTLKQEIEKLLEQHHRSVQDLVEIFGLAPADASPKASGRGNRRTRKLKVYVNPHTGARVETRGGNQKDLKAWKAQYGSDEVESWVKEERD